MDFKVKNSFLWFCFNIAKLDGIANPRSWNNAVTHESALTACQRWELPDQIVTQKSSHTSDVIFLNVFLLQFQFYVPWNKL